MPSLARPLYIVNPVAGAGRARRVVRIVREVLRELNVSAEMAFSKGPGDAESLAQQGALEGWSPIVGVGGDGTLQELINGILSGSSRPPLGIVPSGTGNDFVRGLSLPLDPALATHLTCTGVPGKVDVGLCGQRYYLNVGGVGFDADVAAAISGSGWLGRQGNLTYMLFTLKQLISHENRQLIVHLDGRILERRALLVAVANGRYYGGGMMICPQADPADGLLDVCIIGDVSRWEILRLLPGVYSGKHVGHPSVEFHRARVVRIEAPEGTQAHIDGEIVGPTPLEFRVIPDALSIVGMGRRAGPVAE